MDSSADDKEIFTLVIDDEESIRFFLTETLQQIGHQVTTAASGEEALALLRESQFDLVMLDLRLGGRIDGLKILETAKWRWPEIIVIILTAHGSLESAMSAIQEGIDGYLLKPVTPTEVRQTITEVFEKQKAKEKIKGDKTSSILQWEDLTIDLEKHHVEVEGEKIELTTTEFSLLSYLIQNAHQVHSPKKLVRVTRGYDSEDGQEAKELMKWHIHRLRKKLEPDPADPKYILNVRGVGYTFGDKKIS